MNWRVQVDTETCVSSGKCVADHPTAFGFDDDELAEVLEGVTSLDTAALLKVARRCPSGAIAMFDEAGDPVEV